MSGGAGRSYSPRTGAGRSYSPRTGAKARAAGVTLVEMLVASAMLLVVIAGVAALYVGNKMARTSEAMSEVMEAELRLGMDHLLYHLRGAGYGVPAANLNAWIPWVTGLTVNPRIVAGLGSDPDSVSVARCTGKPIGYLAADAAIGATQIDVDAAAAAAIDVTVNPRLITINDLEPALVLSKSGTGTRLNIDTNPLVTGAQGLTRAHRGPDGTMGATGVPICRVDVVTFSVDPTSRTLQRDDHQGAGPQVLVDGIRNLKIVADSTGIRAKYTVTVTAEGSGRDPLGSASAPPVRSLVSTASRRN